MYISSYHALTYHRVPCLGRHVLPSAKLLELVVMVRHDVVGGATLDEVDDIVLTESLLQGKQRAQHYEQCLLAVALHLRMQTVVAIATVVLRIFLAEVVQQKLAAAHRRLSIGCCLLKQLSTDILLCHWLALHEFLEFLQVLVRVECKTDALAAVASGASRLLIVPLQTLGYVVMDDESHVGLVDAHAEGYGGYNHVDALHKEVVLCLRACG